MTPIEAVESGPNPKDSAREQPAPKYRFLSAEELKPFKLNRVADLLGLFKDIPKAANPCTLQLEGSARLEPLNRNGDYLPPRQGKPVTKGPLKNLLTSLEVITKAKFEKIDFETIRLSLNDEIIREIFNHWTTLNRKEYNHFVGLIGYWYAEIHQKAVIERKHALNPFYHHPTDLHVKSRQREQIDIQLSTFTEVNVNSWTITDDEDSTIVYSSEGGAQVLESEEEINPFGPRLKLDFPRKEPRRYQPGYDEAMEAFDAMTMDTALAEKRYREWIAFGEAQIEVLGETLVGGGILEIPRSRNRVWRVAFKLKDDPREATKRILLDPNVRRVTDQQYSEILTGLNNRLLQEYNQTGSDYWKWKTWQVDLKLRKLRHEITEKLQQRWRFLLQHLAPKIFYLAQSHCAHPMCQYHDGDPIPAESFRLNFMDPSQHAGQVAYFLNETTKDSPETPGRAADGQMWFCLKCIEDLFNGENLITEIGDSAITAKTPSPKLLWSPSTKKIDAEWQRRRDAVIARVLASPSGSPSRKRGCDEEDDENPPRKVLKSGRSATPHPVLVLRNLRTKMDRTDDSVEAKNGAGPAVLFNTTSEDSVVVSDGTQAESASPVDMIHSKTSPNNTGVDMSEAQDDVVIMNSSESASSPNSPALYDTNQNAYVFKDVSPNAKARADGTVATTARPLDTQLSPEYMILTPDEPNSTSVINTPGLETDAPTPSTPVQPVPVFPIPPRLTRTPVPPGLTPFAHSLSSFIHPELRHTITESLTLTPLEYLGLRKWKKMCTHKAIWLNPHNRAFINQIPHPDGLHHRYDHSSADNPWSGLPEPDNIIGSRQVEGHRLTVKDMTRSPTSPCTSSLSSPEPLNGLSAHISIPPHCTLKLLSEVMALIDRRAIKMPRDDGVRSIAQREWPFRKFWEAEFEKERRRMAEEKVGELIRENERVIVELRRVAEGAERREVLRRRELEEAISRLEAEAEAEEKDRETEKGRRKQMGIQETIKRNEEVIEEMRMAMEEEGVL